MRTVGKDVDDVANEGVLPKGHHRGRHDIAGSKDLEDARRRLLKGKSFPHLTTMVVTSPCLVPLWLTIVLYAGTGLLQIASMWFGYLSYHDFGWRIFKLFGIDFNMRQVGASSRLRLK